jgi:hypothetical protein
MKTYQVNAFGFKGFSSTEVLLYYEAATYGEAG